MIKQRDLFLVPFPFSDQSGRKVRPVMIISNSFFNENSEDVLVVGVTSNMSKDKYSLPLMNKNMEEGTLLTPCCIKVENVLKIDKELIIKKMGRIEKGLFNKVIPKILEIIKGEE